MKLLVLAAAAGALRPPRRTTTRLRATNEDDIGKQAKGFYIRPSAAIERGGGFFIPGLEGAKLRIALGGGLLALSGLSIASSGDAPLAVRLSECIAAFAAAGIVVPYVLPEVGTEEDVRTYRGGAPVVVGGAPADAAWACGAIRSAFPDAAFVALLDPTGRVLCAERTSPATAFGQMTAPTVRRRDAPALFDLLGEADGAAAVPSNDMVWLVASEELRDDDRAWVAALLGS
jgi:hypothetical protein